jgi:hypothetical protein
MDYVDKIKSMAHLLLSFIILILQITCRLSIYGLFIMGFSSKFENYENYLQHYVFSSRHEIKRYVQSMLYFTLVFRPLFLLDVRCYKLLIASRCCAHHPSGTLCLLTLDPLTFENILFRVCLRPLANFSAHQIRVGQHLRVKSGIPSTEWASNTYT